MNMALKRSICSAVGGLWVALIATAGAQPAQVIFNNSTNDLGVRFNPGTAEVGDQIKLGGDPAFRNLTLFTFEYWGTNTANPSALSGDVKAQVRFYLNDGVDFNTYASPGTKFWDSGLFDINPTERSQLVFTGGTDFGGGALVLPAEEFTWTVQFFGMDLTDSVGLDLYSPPTVGQDYPDYWSYNGSSWLLLTNQIGPMSFGATMSAVPEPSSMMLSLMGGTGLLLAAGRLRKRA